LEVDELRRICGGTPQPKDRVNQQLAADPGNQLWESDFAYVSTWQGWLYVVFVTDVFAYCIVSFCVSLSMTTDFVLDALEQAQYARQPGSPAAMEARRITRTDGHNISAFATASALQRPRASYRLVAEATVTTRRCRKQSTACNEPT
jgi:transposase InsO family protein